MSRHWKFTSQWIAVGGGAFLALLLSSSSALAISTHTLLDVTGEGLGDHFGTAVTSVGDFNGDGHPDFAVSAPLNDAGGTDAGRVYVYSGAAPHALLLTITGVTLEHLGQSIASAGHFHSKSYDDLIVGCPLSSAGGVQSGRVLIFFGGPSPSATPGLVITGVAGQELGTSVAGGGDVNGDGFDDVVAGAPLDDGIGTDAGRAYVYYGGSTPNSTADMVVATGFAGDNLGTSVALCDFNDDGFSDVVAGAPLNDVVGTDAGAIYVFFGAKTADTMPDVIFHGLAAGDHFGCSVASAGDMNADGSPDIIVGANLNDAVASNAGAAYVYYGGPLAGIGGLTLLGLHANDQFGTSVSSAGDVNLDTYADVVVGAPFGGPSSRGQAYVFLGGLFPNSGIDLTVTGPPTGVNFGGSVAAAGDLDGDGFGDLLVGDATDFGAGNANGRAEAVLVFPFQLVSPGPGVVWVDGAEVTVSWRGHDAADLEKSTNGVDWDFVSGPLGGHEDNHFSFSCPGLTASPVAHVRLKYSGEVANQSNSVVGGPFEILPSYPSAAAALALINRPMAILSADTVGNATVMADFNGDGVADLVIGDPGCDTVATNAGRAYVLLAAQKSLADSTPARRLVLSRGLAGDAFGFAVAAVGDLNGDGYEDIAVSAPKADVGGMADAGKVFVFFGGAAPDTTPDLILNGFAAGDRFGYAIAGTGDFNDDGFDDLVVSAPFCDSTGTDAGRAYVYLGGHMPSSVPNFIFNGRAAGDRFGTSLATDIRIHDDPRIPSPQDGDLLCSKTFGMSGEVACKKRFMAIGSPYADSGGVDAGAVYLIGYGHQPGFEHTFLGPQAGAHFGSCLAKVSDWNGDGNDDLAVGAPGFDGTGPSSGLVDVLTLDPDPFDPVCWVDGCGGPLFQFIGPDPGDQFGSALSSIDFTGDGLADLLIGAPGSDAAGLDAGMIFGFAGHIVTSPQPPDPCDAPFCPYQPEFEVKGVRPGDRLGTSIASVFFEPNPSPDFDSDPQPDPWVGSSSPDPHPWRGGFVTNIGDSVMLYEFNRYELLSPHGGDVWNVGGLETVSWFGNWPVDIQLSIDGGANYQTIASAAGRDGFQGAGPDGSRNYASIRVPHTPTRFGRVRLIPQQLWRYCIFCPPPPCTNCPVFEVPGEEVMVSTITIQTQVSLLSFVAKESPEGVALTWSTDPVVSADGIAGYRLYRVTPGGTTEGTRIGSDLITERGFVDRDATAGAQYRLTAVNGLQEELELGRTGLGSQIVGLRTWPSPVSAQGAMTVEFAAPELAPGITATDLDVGVFDVAGRRVATIAQGYVRPELGGVSLKWNLADRSGERVSPGLYFVRVSAPSARLRLEHKVVVLP